MSAFYSIENHCVEGVDWNDVDHCSNHCSPPIHDDRRDCCFRRMERDDDHSNDYDCWVEAVSQPREDCD